MAVTANTTEGLTRAATLLMNDITHLSVGTGAAAPTAADPQLGEETNRLAATNKFQTANQFQIRGMFINSNLPTTLQELGLHMNGSNSANAGEIIARVTDEIAKGSDDLLIVFDVTVS